MKKVEIIVDINHATNVEDIESVLNKIKKEFMSTEINANVNILSFGESVNKDLQLIDLPINKSEQKVFFIGANDYNGTIKSKLENKPDLLIFISDCMDLPIEPSTLENSKESKLVFIGSRNTQEDILNPLLIENLVNKVATLPNVKFTNTNEYTSIDSILNSTTSLQHRIGKLRMITSREDQNLKIKP